ncbi:MAG: hypothetical protein GXP04_12895 [Alphaproteobacteria bacterium]|nr:hypothetical protein [Alphaproteobacteria bacterium]
MTDIGPLEILKLAIYYASYLYFVAAPIFAWLIIKLNGATRYAMVAALTVITCLAYARFIEPRILLSTEHEIALNGCFQKPGAIRIAVFSDTHNGLFGNAMSIRRIAKRVQAANADFVLIPGDYIYFLHPDRFEETFTAFADIDAPVFAVLGNHDLGLPGPDLRVPLREFFSRTGIRLIDDQALKLINNKFAIELVGLSDHWAQNQKLSLLEGQASIPRLVLTHNPAAVRDFTTDMNADLLIGGHTHGGQIQLPLLTCWLTGVCGDIAYGLREERGVQIFTTSGTGMVGLPMRFRVPPRIDVLNVSYMACIAS